MAWNAPNQAPQISAWDSCTLRTESPLQMETANASIERLMPIMIKSNKLIPKYLQIKSKGRAGQTKKTYPPSTCTQHAGEPCADKSRHFK